MTNKDKIRKACPEAYYVAGVGWCGPDWETADKMDKAQQLASWLDLRPRHNGKPEAEIMTRGGFLPVSKTEVR